MKINYIIPIKREREKTIDNTLKKNIKPYSSELVLTAEFKLEGNKLILHPDVISHLSWLRGNI